jgi:ESCRT-II complex subunit VPS36
MSDSTRFTSSEATFQCPRCTFGNHPSLLSCEMCGASLVSSSVPAHLLAAAELHRSESPGPSLNTLSVTSNEAAESVKFSFRAGGEKIFCERLKGAMVQRKWLLQNAPPIPKPNRLSLNDTTAVSDGASSEEPQKSLERKKVVGIAGLERRGVDMRKNNELVIGNAFEDLEALMGSAKEIVALAESFASKLNTTGGAGGVEANAVLSESATALGLVTTKDMLAGTGGASESLYLSELARNLAEFLTDDSRGVLKREGGIMSLVDLWAVFNRARGGVELVSPMDFEKAAGLWEKLKLPVRLRRFRSGLLVVQGREWTDEKTIAGILDWLKDLHSAPGGYMENLESHWEMELFGRGVTAQETAEKFGWSVGVASEELEMAEERGALCRDEGVEGVRFWENWIVGENEWIKGDAVHSHWQTSVCIPQDT